MKKPRSKRDPMERVVFVLPRSLRKRIDAFAKEFTPQHMKPNRSAAARSLLYNGLSKIG